jgi:peptidoglycan hydrolase CwlO-like protein
MNFLLENWLGLMGVLSAPLMWFLGGRQQKAKDLKRQDVEIETAEVDYADKVRDLYEKLNAKLLQENEILKSDKDAILTEFKEEKEYFRTQVDDLRKQAGDMQIQFNAMQIAYAKEVEQSQNWEKLHRELSDKYQSLEKDHEELKKLYGKLKEDFEKHKKSTKT